MKGGKEGRQKIEHELERWLAERVRRLLSLFPLPLPIAKLTRLAFPIPRFLIPSAFEEVSLIATP